MEQLISRLGLGTAQFGGPYGRFNSKGAPSTETVGQLLRRSYCSGIRLLDTACQYDKSELVLGQWQQELQDFSIVTKTPIFSELTITRDNCAKLREALVRSLNLMRVKRIDGLLIHHAPNLLSTGGEYLFDELSAIKAEGLVSRIGVSVYSGEIAEQIAERYPVDLIQAPVNLVDRRLINSGTLARLHERGIEIHARSAFLQGLLLASPEMLPPAFADAREILDGFQNAAKAAGVRPAQAALHYLLQIPQISRVLIGVETIGQLDEILTNFPAETGMDYSDFVIDDVRILDPSCWVS